MRKPVTCALINPQKIVCHTLCYPCDPISILKAYFKKCTSGYQYQTVEHSRIGQKGLLEYFSVSVLHLFWNTSMFKNMHSENNSPANYTLKILRKRIRNRYDTLGVFYQSIVSLRKLRSHKYERNLYCYS